MKGSGIKNRSLYTLDSAFDLFVNNSTFNVLSTSSLNGMILKLKLNPNIVSPFLNVTIGPDFDKPVQSLIIKFILIDKKTTIVKFKTIEKETMIQDQFNKEVNIQIDVYNKSITDDEFIFQPICPAIVKVYENITDAFKKKIVENIVDPIEKSLVKDFFSLNYSIHSIVMEAIEGYNVLLKHCDSKYERFALFELWRLHKYGYTHGDYHKENVLINAEYEYYFDKNIKGRALILDFGRSSPIQYNTIPDLNSVLKNEISSLSDPHWPSYIWLSYYFNNCQTETIHFLTNIYNAHIQQNRLNIKNIFISFPQFNNDLNKIKETLIVRPVFVLSEIQKYKKEKNYRNRKVKTMGGGGTKGDQGERSSLAVDSRRRSYKSSSKNKTRVRIS
jgi:hypothetical protein